ncbi:hypothetical protein C2G38_2225584 [Gigaspora rosea]|uniref:C2H2-type domain-containing protein n=1 Tax=Gigaspora rosea TaxID=44941 RepID=A0A397U826_9GLOM|nr:hypothetical protein C2G38_2225584 [Gigaspora rosea]
MCWLCEYCNREFSQFFALTQHISQKHPYLKGETDQSLHDKQLDKSIWDLPDYRPSKDGLNKFSFKKQVDDSVWDLPNNRPSEYDSNDYRKLPQHHLCLN